VNPFFDDLGRRLAAAAAKRGAKIEPPELDARLAEELLELARVAAHSQERRFAPLASFMAGVAAERARCAAGVSASEQAELVREGRLELEAEPGREARV
jgi:hypothetical protein